MFDLPPVDATDAPEPWLAAPMPDAAWCLLRDGGLYCIEGGERLSLSPPLLARLSGAGPVGECLAVADAVGAAWRLRREEAGFWRLQARSRSRVRIGARLRMALAPALSSQVLHELRNPMNALSLHADLLARTLPKCEDPQQRARAESSAKVIKTRLADLNQRQGAMVALWLAPLDAGTDAVARVPLATIVDGGLQLLRGHAAVNEVMLRTLELDRLAIAPLAFAAAPLGLILVAILMAACTEAQAMGREVTVGAVIVDAGLALDIAPLPLAGGFLSSLDVLDMVAVFAAFTLLLDDSTVAFEMLATGGVRLRFA